MIRSPLATDDRAVSIAVTHVLTIGITTVLISGLLIGAGTMLDSERDRSTEASLETIGERLSNEISAVDRIAEDDDEVTVHTSHQRQVTNSLYTVELGENCDHPLLHDDDQDCLVLSAQGEDVEVAVPVQVNADIDTSSAATGGTIVIEWDGSEISISDGDS